MAYNYGIVLLKIIACFGVVSLHFGKDAQWATFSVPVFMFVSLYLGGEKLSGGNILGRLRRLYVPFAAWGMIYWVIYSIIEHRLDAVALVQQLIIGAPVCPPLYFMALLMSFTIIIWLVTTRVPKPVRFYVLVILFLLCFVFQYTGLNFRLFASLSVSVGAALGRFVELLPFAVSGCLGARLHGKFPWMPGIGLVLLLFFLLPFNYGSPPGFAYQGVRLCFLALGISLLFICAGEKWGIKSHFLKMIVKGGGGGL